MPSERYVVLGLAPARAGWFRAVAQWAQSAILPAEFVKCVSADEVRARLASRPLSALLVDAGLPAVDRDLLAAARRAGCAVLVVDDDRVRRDWIGLGASSVLAPSFGRDELLTALACHARPIRRRVARSGEPPAPAEEGGRRGLLAALCGPGGTGTSTLAIALAQALADRTDRVGGVGGLGGFDGFDGGALLADLRLHAEQAMLHDVGDVIPGVQELVEAHRSGRLTPGEVRALTFAIEARGYELLLGLRRARAWPVIRPRAFEAALDSVRRTYRFTVCDVDADVEGEHEGGSLDVEERNTMARTTLLEADVVFAVGLPTMKGVHGLARVTRDVLELGVDATRVVPVLNRAPRAPRARASLTLAVAELVGPAPEGGRPATPIFVPDRGVDAAMRDGVRLPSAVGEPLANACTAVAGAVDRGDALLSPGARVLRRIRPGSLGTAPDHEAAS